VNEKEEKEKDKKKRAKMSVCRPSISLIFAQIVR
jgi:hypothetical protein